MVTFSRATRERALARAGYRCEQCGLHVSQTRIDFHHIIPQTQSNIKIYSNAVIQGLSNCRVLCQGCHANDKNISKKRLDKEM